MTDLSTLLAELDAAHAEIVVDGDTFRLNAAAAETIIRAYPALREEIEQLQRELADLRFSYSGAMLDAANDRKAWLVERDVLRALVAQQREALREYRTEHDAFSDLVPPEVCTCQTCIKARAVLAAEVPRE